MTILLVSPSMEYKETYIQGMRELYEDSLKRNDGTGKASLEFTEDLENKEQNFEEFIRLERNKELPSEQRMSRYDLLPEEVKKNMSTTQIEELKSQKIKPGQSWWIMNKDDNGNMSFIGEMSIRPTELTQEDLKLGAKEFQDWKGSLGKNISVGVETSSFLIPSARGKGAIDTAREILLEKLKEKGIDTIVSKVDTQNFASQKKQQELVNWCGGKSFETKYKNKDYKRYIIDVSPEKFSQELKKKIALKKLNDERLGKNQNHTPVKKTELPKTISKSSKTYS